MRRIQVWSLIAFLALVPSCSGGDGADGEAWEPCAEGSEAVPHPTGGAEVVLRVEVVGGLPLPAPMPEELPQLTLYGDGHIVAVDGAADRLVPALVERRLTEAEMQELLHAAEAACLLEREAFLGIPDAYDVPGVVFLTNTGATSHRTTAVGLGWSELDSAVPAEQGDQRQALLDVHAKALELVRSGAEPASVERLGVFVADAQGPPSDETWPVVGWPLEEPLAMFGEPAGSDAAGARCAVVAGEEARTLLATVAELPSDRQPSWKDAGGWYQVYLRPMLPDEIRCAALAG